MNIDLAPLDYLKNQQVQISINAANNVISADTFSSILRFGEVATTMNLVWTSNVHGDLNLIVKSFFENPPMTHLMIVDPWTKFEPWHILALLSSKKHIIGASTPIIQRTNSMIVEGNISEVSFIDHSFVMISKEALIYLQDHELVIGNDLMKSFFELGKRNGKIIPINQEFSRRWQDLGGRTWIHTKVKPILHKYV